MSITIDSKGWIKEAIGIYYGADSFGPFAPGQPKWIVLHGTAWPDGTATLIANSWAAEAAAGNLGAATHLIIDKDGTFTQGISLLNTGAGNSGALDSPRAPYLPAGNLNMNTISIECCKYDVNDNDLLTNAQVATLFPLCAAICDFCAIPRNVVTIEDTSNGGIIRHRDCDLKYRANCPGPMPFADLQNYLKGGVEAMFTNSRCVQVWESFFDSNHETALPIPPRDTGIFNEWRNQWIAGHFKGACLGWEYPIDGGVAQNFAGGTCYWINSQAGWF